MATKPIIQSMLLVERTFVDPTTKKRTIVGVFDSIRAPHPAFYPDPLYLYVSLTGVRDHIELMFYYVDLASNEILVEAGPIPLSCNDPLASLDFSVRMPPLPLPHSGVFCVELHASGELVGMMRITVQVGSEEEGEHNE